MFFLKTHKRLNKRLRELEDEIKELNQVIHDFKHPRKYSNGQEVGDYVICYPTGIFQKSIFYPSEWVYDLYNKKTKQINAIVTESRVDTMLSIKKDKK